MTMLLSMADTASSFVALYLYNAFITGISSEIALLIIDPEKQHCNEHATISRHRIQSMGSYENSDDQIIQ